MLREQKGSAQDHTEPRIRIQLFSWVEFFPPMRSFHLPRPLLIVSTGHVMVSGADWRVGLAWMSFASHAPTAQTNFPELGKPSSDSSTYLYAVLQARMHASICLCPRFKPRDCERNLEGLKEGEERKRRGDQSMLTDMYKNRSEAPESRAFAFRSYFQ